RRLAALPLGVDLVVETLAQRVELELGAAPHRVDGVLHHLLELFLELLLERPLLGTPLFERLLQRFGARRRYAGVDLRFPLDACRFGARRRQALAFVGALLAGFGYSLVVMLFQGRELLIERAS